MYAYAMYAIHRNDVEDGWSYLYTDANATMYLLFAHVVEYKIMINTYQKSSPTLLIDIDMRSTLNVHAQNKLTKIDFSLKIKRVLGANKSNSIYFVHVCAWRFGILSMWVERSALLMYILSIVCTHQYK